MKLNSGLAIVHLKSGNRVTLQEVRKVIDDRGFTPADAIVRFSGTINSSNGKTWVTVTDNGEVLNLNEAITSAVTSQPGKTLTFEGRVVAPDKHSKKNLQLTELRIL